MVVAIMTVFFAVVFFTIMLVMTVLRKLLAATQKPAAGPSTGAVIGNATPLALTTENENTISV